MKGKTILKVASILLLSCIGSLAGNVEENTGEEIMSEETIAKAFDSIIARRLTGDPSSNAVPSTVVKTCSPISFSTLKSTFSRYGDVNPNYVAMTKEEATLFPDLFWGSKKKKEYITIVGIMKKRILRWAGRNLNKLLNFRRMLLRKLRLPLGRFPPISATNRSGKRQVVSGSSVTTVRDCYDAGSVDAVTQNSRICTSCMATTVLPANRFPRYINEIVCKASAPVCFQGEGYCGQKRFTMTFMYKTGKCIPITQDGKTVYIEEWIPSQQSISTCCECQIRSGSWLKYLL